MKKKPKNKVLSKKKTLPNQKEKSSKKEENKWKDFLSRHTKSKEKK